MHVANQKIPLNSILLARIADELSFISWTKTVDGQKNRNRPKSILDSLLHPKQETENENNCYTSGAEFEEAWRKITEGKQ